MLFNQRKTKTKTKTKSHEEFQYFLFFIFHLVIFPTCFNHNFIHQYQVVTLQGIEGSNSNYNIALITQVSRQVMRFFMFFVLDVSTDPT